MGTVTNVKIRASNVSWGGEDLGYLDGAIEVAFEEQVYDITTHQTGTQVIGQIRTGKSAQVTLTLKEATVARIKSLLEVGGGNDTPVGEGATQLSGWGTSKNFTGTFGDAQRLVIHPIHMGASKAEDFVAWKAYPMLENVSFSGEEATLIPVTFMCFMDDTKPAAINIIAVGDHSQTAYDDAP